MRGAFAALVSVALVVGCATSTPPADPLLLGPSPPAEFDPEPRIRAAMERVLKDPFSAQYRRLAGPVPGQALSESFRPMKGWAYCYMINAKNSFGAYTGFKPAYFVVRDNEAWNGQFHLIAWSFNAERSSWNCF